MLKTVVPVRGGLQDFAKLKFKNVFRFPRCMLIRRFHNNIKTDAQKAIYILLKQ